MVSDDLTLQLRSLWFPTKASAERWFLTSIEFNLNQPLKGDQPSVAEVACATGRIDQALSILPPLVPETTRKEMQRLLQPWPDGRYTDAYGRSGGILNVFTPAWNEQQDDVWAGLVTGWEAESHADESTRQNALRALEQQWNSTPHPFFAGLTPAQVMVGGGPREAELAFEFLENLKRMYDRHTFESEGEALIKSLMALRAWQCYPQRDGHTVFETIVAERDELLARRARALAQRANRAEPDPGP
jgi:hypothetical protein